MRPKGPKVQKCAVSSGILANVKFLGGGGGRVQCAGAAGHDIALSIGEMGISVGGMEFSVGGMGISVAGIEKSIGDIGFSIGGIETSRPNPRARRAIYTQFLPSKKCFNPSAALRFALSINTNVAEGFGNRTLQHGSAKTRHFPPQKKAARPPFNQSSQPSLCTLNGCLVLK